MAEQTHDIWNDDDGEAEEQKRRPRRVLRFLLILAAVLAVVLAAAWRDGTGFDALRRLFSYQGQTAEEAEVYRYDASSSNRFAALGDRLAVLSNTSLVILDGSGGTVWSASVNMTSPALVQSGERAVAYDVGGTELYVIDREGEVLHLTAEEGAPFIAANLSRDGYLAVTSQSQTGKGRVMAYAPDYAPDLDEPLFRFDASERFVVDACVAEGGRSLAAVTLGQEAGTFVSNLVIYSLTEAGEVEPSADYDVTDGLVMALTERDGRVLTVSDTCLTLADLDGEVEASYGYGGSYLRGYDLNGDGFLTLLLNRYRSGSVGRLVTLDEDGGELASLDVNREVLGLSAAGRYLAVLYTDSLVIYNDRLQEYASLEGTGYASGVLMRSDGSALLLSAEHASLFLP